MLRRISGNSMLPTLTHGQIVYVRRWLYSPRVNDVVMIRHRGLDKIKRIKAIHGHDIKVVGDNPLESTDSRQFGALPVTLVVGKVLSTNFFRR